MLKLIVGFCFVMVLASTVYADEILLKVTSRPDVTQRALLLTADKATHTIMLFTGGNGIVKLKDDGKIRKAKHNFVIRTREHFLHAGMNVVIFDAPSDHYRNPGMRGGYRNSSDHITDIKAIMAELKKYTTKPLWLSGTSRGTESVAYAAIHADQLAGIILTSSMTVDNDSGEPVTSLELGKITLPVFIGAHRHDDCWVTPPTGAEEIKSGLKNAKVVMLRMYDGGDEPISEACKARSAHGFLGIESQVLKDIIAFIKSN